MLRSRSRFFGLPRSSQPGFPSPLHGSSYSAPCSFPFVLPGLTPAAVPPVLALRFRLRPFSLSSAFFRPLLFGPDYSASCPFFSLLPVLPWQRFLRCSSVPFVPDLSSSVSPVSMRPFRFRYSASCASFLRLAVSYHRYYAATGLLFPARPFPFAFALGSGYLAG